MQGLVYLEFSRRKGNKFHAWCHGYDHGCYGVRIKIELPGQALTNREAAIDYLSGIYAQVTLFS